MALIFSGIILYWYQNFMMWFIFKKSSNFSILCFIYNTRKNDVWDSGKFAGYVRTRSICRIRRLFGSSFRNFPTVSACHENLTLNRDWLFMRWMLVKVREYIIHFRESVQSRRFIYFGSLFIFAEEKKKYFSWTILHTRHFPASGGWVFVWSFSIRLSFLHPWQLLWRPFYCVEYIKFLNRVPHFFSLDKILKFALLKNEQIILCLSNLYTIWIIDEIYVTFINTFQVNERSLSSVEHNYMYYPFISNTYVHT